MFKLSVTEAESGANIFSSWGDKLRFCDARIYLLYQANDFIIFIISSYTQILLSDWLFGGC